MGALISAAVMLAILVTTVLLRTDSAAEALMLFGIPCLKCASVTTDSVCLTNNSQIAGLDTGNSIIEIIPKNDGESEESQANTEEKTTVLVYHTHTHESYTPCDAYPYANDDETYRTDDNDRNIVAIGKELCKLLEERGFCVIHDITNHEPPKLATAYERSLATMERNKAANPTIDVYIDVHRDASGSKGATDYCTINGIDTARLMFVVGKGTGASGNGFDAMPNYESNYALAEKISGYLSGISDELVRPIRVKTGRYNQHVSNKCLLVEVGHNMNTQEQALAALPYLADAIKAAIADE